VKLWNGVLLVQSHDALVMSLSYDSVIVSDPHISQCGTWFIESRGYCGLTDNSQFLISHTGSTL